MQINNSPIRSSPLLTTPSASSAETSTITIPLIDPRIQQSTLLNGIKVYTAAHSHPTPNQATIRLVVRVGAIHEKQKERGVAHFVEHAVFQGIPSLPSVAEFNKKISLMGLIPGADENASTGQYRTCYYLDIPLEEPENLETAIRTLSELASCAELSDSGINAERAPILDELRLRRTVNQKFMHEKVYPHLFQGTPYADHFPGGSPSIVAGCSPSLVRNFYHTWYRPDRMAIIAVGDFDRDKVLNLIEAYFGAIPAPSTSPITSPTNSPGKHEGTSYHCIFDNELTISEILIYALNPIRKAKDLEEEPYQSLVNTLTLSMLNKRLEERSFSPTHPLNGAKAILRKASPFPYSCIRTSCTAEGSANALQTIIVELGRIARDGFSEKELALAIEDMHESIQTQLKECGKDSIDDIADACENHFLKDISLLNEEAILLLTEQLLPTVDLADCQACAKDLFPENGALVCFAGPESAKPFIDEEKLSQAVANAKTHPLSPYRPPVTPKSLFTEEPVPGKIISKEKIKGDFTLYTLSNGATVVLKNTEFENDTFFLRSINDQGLLHAKDPLEKHAFLLGDALTDISGIGPLNGTELNHYLAPRQISWIRFFEDDYTLFKAHGVPKELETALQLYSLSFAKNRYEPALFAPLKQRRVEVLKANNKADTRFAKAIRSHNHSDHPFFKPFEAEMLEQVSLEQSIAARNNYFRDPSHFKMAIVGNIDEQEVESLLEKYVGSIPLPASPSRKNPYPQSSFPAGITMVSIQAELGEKCQSILTFPCAPCPSSDIDKERLRNWMMLLLNGRLMAKLRAEMQHVYTTSISYGDSKISQDDSARIFLNFTGKPEEVEQNTRAALDVLQKFQQEGPTEEEVAHLKDQLRNTRAKLFSSNEFWANNLSIYQMAGIPLTKLTTVEELISQLTPQMLQDEARSLFDLNHYSRATLYPPTK